MLPKAPPISEYHAATEQITTTESPSAAASPKLLAVPAPQKEPDDLPDVHDAAADADALGALARSRQRIQIVRYLVAHPDGYFGDIQDGTSIPTGSLGKHLRDLETQGIIMGDIPLEGRHGRSVRYRADADRVDALITKLRTDLLG